MSLIDYYLLLVLWKFNYFSSRNPPFKAASKIFCREYHLVQTKADKHVYMCDSEHTIPN
jgi:hypothetical protein